MDTGQGGVHNKTLIMLITVSTIQFVAVDHSSRVMYTLARVGLRPNERCEILLAMPTTHISQNNTTVLVFWSV